MVGDWIGLGRPVRSIICVSEQAGADRHPAFSFNPAKINYLLVSWLGDSHSHLTGPTQMRMRTEGWLNPHTEKCHWIKKLRVVFIKKRDPIHLISCDLYKSKWKMKNVPTERDPLIVFPSMLSSGSLYWYHHHHGGMIFSMETCLLHYHQTGFREGRDENNNKVHCIVVCH